MNLRTVTIAVIVFSCTVLHLPATWAADTLPSIGAGQNIGCKTNPEQVKMLRIEKSGTYENYLVDGEWDESNNLVKITANNVVFKNSEIRFGGHNGLALFGKNIEVDSCKIHHMLKGTFFEQRDAHGISGAPHDLIIRNTEIHHVSGDSVQFDPGKEPWGNVLIENCTFWTGPLDADYAGFKKGERPGENALDTKQKESNPRSRMIIRNSLFYGWGKGQIDVMAAMNLKSNVEVVIENCVFRDNDYAFRLRGPADGAIVTVLNTAIYDTIIAFRLEDGLRNFVVKNIGFGDGIKEKFVKRKADSKLFLFEMEDEATRNALGMPLAKISGSFYREIKRDGPVSQELRASLNEQGLALSPDATLATIVHNGKEVSGLTSDRRQFTLIPDRQLEVYETAPTVLMDLWRDGTPVPARVRELFAANSLPLTAEATINATKREKRWEIFDEQGNRSFVLEKHSLHDTILVSGLAGFVIQGIQTAPPYDEIMRRGAGILTKRTK